MPNKKQLGRIQELREQLEGVPLFRVREGRDTWHGGHHRMYYGGQIADINHRTLEEQQSLVGSGLWERVALERIGDEELLQLVNDGCVCIPEAEPPTETSLVEQEV